MTTQNATIETCPSNVLPFVVSLLRWAESEGGALSPMLGRWTSFDVRARFIAVASGFMANTSRSGWGDWVITDAGRAWVANQPAVIHDQQHAAFA